LLSGLPGLAHPTKARPLAVVEVQLLAVLILLEVVPSCFFTILDFVE
jgi:hypothetical protein